MLPPPNSSHSAAAGGDGAVGDGAVGDAAPLPPPAGRPARITARTTDAAKVMPWQ